MLTTSRTYIMACTLFAAILATTGTTFVAPELFAQAKKAPAKKKNAVQTLFEAGAVSLDAGKPEEALKSFLEIKDKHSLQLAPSYQAMLDYMIATCYYQMEKWPDAERVLAAFLEKYKNGTEDPRDNKVASVMISLADVYMRQEKWADSKAMLYKVSRLVNSGVIEKMKAQVVMADVMVKEAEASGNKEETAKGLAAAENLLKNITNGIGWFPEAIEARQRLVKIYIKAGKRAEAEALKNDIDAHLRAGTRGLDPASVIRSNVQSLGIGDSYFMQAADSQDAEQRDELFRQALAVYQGVLRKDALAKFFKPGVESAKNKLDTLTAKYPEPTEDQKKLIETAQAEFDEIDAARADFEGNKDYDAQISFRLGACLFSLGRPWEAYIAFGDVVENHKDFEKISLATYYYIVTLRTMGREEEAQKYCRQFLKEYPDKPEVGDVALLMGQISFDQGDYAKAIENFEWATKNVKSLSQQTRCELDWYTITSWFARAPWGMEVNPEDIKGMGKPGYKPTLTPPTKKTIGLIDDFIRKYGSITAYAGAVEEMYYRKSLLYFYSGFYQETVAGFDEYLEKFPKGSFVPDARYRQAIVQFGVRSKDQAKDEERVDDVLRRCSAWVEDYYQVTEKDLLNPAKIPQIRTDLPFSVVDVESVSESIKRQLPEIYTLIGDAYKRLAENVKGSEGGTFGAPRRMTLADIRTKERLTNNSINAYILAAKTAKTNEESLTFVLEELDKILPQRGEWNRLLDVYNTLYSWDPNSPRALSYLYMKIRCTERAAKTPEARIQAQDESRKILADAILKNLNDPRQDNVEKLITELATRLARKVKRQRVPKDGSPIPTADPNEYTATKAVDEMFTLLKLRGTSTETSLIGRARGLYARAEIYRLLRNEQEMNRNLQTIGSTFKADELSPTILGVVGDYLYEKGDIKTAEEYYKYLMDYYRSSDYADYGFAGYGEIMMKQKNFRKAYEVFDDAITNGVVYGKEVDIRLGRARAMMEMSPDVAKKLGIDKPLDKAYSEFSMIGSVREWKGRATAAALYYKGLVEEKRSRPNEAVNNYRICYLTWKRFPEYAAPAMLRTGIVFEEKLRQPDAAAKIYYEMTMADSRFKDTPEAKEAARRRLKLPAYTPPPPDAPASTSAVKQ